ncbi:hypothetical protein ATL39_0378 [Sinobaca qinghaiensis]|uniref:Uncharacterized protein n=1 Tax=Sinobaca qinghaiensis TaxID=342944 RepID=A0A419V7R9_9BACL|nr:hypothetical protein [Sinobaca qinghaiensis]RKD76166.1 hypothetical protein ATL39_0378 [Sinobaca qinghaiensis]
MNASLETLWLLGMLIAAAASLIAVIIQDLTALAVSVSLLFTLTYLFRSSRMKEEGREKKARFFKRISLFFFFCFLLAAANALTMP